LPIPAKEHTFALISVAVFFSHEKPKQKSLPGNRLRVFKNTIDRTREGINRTICEETTRFDQTDDYQNPGCRGLG
jgi:hypothetical protein